jgi:hypothetical protein
MIVASVMLLLPLAVTFAGRRMAGLGGIIPVDEPPGREKRRATRNRDRALNEGRN